MSSKVKRTCIECQKTFDHYASNGPGKYCSHKCHSNSRKNKSISAFDKECKYCKKFFRTIPSRKRKYCSISCSAKQNILKTKVWENQIGKKPWNEGLTKKTDERVASISNKLRGMKKPWQTEEKYHNWKGDDIKYHGLHKWVNKKLGKPNFCELCKEHKDGKYQWANKDHSYKRNLTDWIRLCAKCHVKYDERGFKRGHETWGKTKKL